MVVMNEGVKESSEKRSRQQDLPTPESPMSRSLIYDRSRIRMMFVVVGDGPDRSAGETYKEIIVSCAGHGVSVLWELGPETRL